MAKRKKIFLILLFSLFLLLFLTSFSQAERRLETTYPDIPGAVTPMTIKTGLPEYIRYIFNFAIIISGLIAFGALIYGGVRWLTSTGNPAALADAKNQILASFLGLIILFSSYLILTTINPELKILKATPEPLGGITLYKNADCLGVGKPIVRDKQNLGESYDVRSIKFLAKAEELEVEFYNNEECLGEPFDRQISQEQACVNKSVSGVECVKVRWIPGGVYLCSGQYQGDVCEGDEIYIPGDTPSLGAFNNRAQSIKIRNIGGFEYGAVLHDEPGYRGGCKIFTKEGEGEYIFREGDLGDFRDRASAVTVFTLGPGPGIGDGITFYDHENFGGESSPEEEEDGHKKSVDCTRITRGIFPFITSMKMDPDGAYIAILYGGGLLDKCKPEPYNICQVFKESDLNFRKHPIGRCNCIIGDWGCRDCLSHFIILPTK